MNKAYVADLLRVLMKESTVSGPVLIPFATFVARPFVSRGLPYLTPFHIARPFTSYHVHPRRLPPPTHATASLQAFAASLGPEELEELELASASH